MSNTSSWIICLQPNPQAKLRLICFPYAGSGANAFRPWVARLPGWIEPWALQYPGRETRWAEPSIKNVAPLVEGLSEAVCSLKNEGAMAFFGHSLGALLCFETACALPADHAGRLTRLIVSGRRAPSIPPANPPISRLPDGEFLERLRNLNGTPKEVLEHEELMELLIPALRADFHLDETYEPVSRRIPVNLSIYGGKSDPYVTHEHLSAWGSHTTGASTIHYFPGDHFYFKEPTTPMFSVLAEELLAFL